MYIPPIKEVYTGRHRTAVEVARPEANITDGLGQTNLIFVLLGFAGGIFAL